MSEACGSAGVTLIAGFVIERLIEPTPDRAMENSHPDTFEKLSREPSFILFKLRKVKQDQNPNRPADTSGRAS